MSLIKGTALIHKWKARFGLGHYRIAIQLMPDVPEAWARSFYDIEEEWGIIELPDDEQFPPETLELLVLHELAHGLLKLSESGDVLNEQACNRIARMALGNYRAMSMNEHQASVVGEAYYEQGDEKKAAHIERRDWLNVTTDALPDKQREVVNLLYFEGLSLREAGEVLGVDVHTVFRWRESALDSLRKFFAALDGEYGDE